MLKNFIGLILTIVATAAVADPLVDHWKAGEELCRPHLTTCRQLRCPLNAPLYDFGSPELIAKCLHIHGEYEKAVQAAADAAKTTSDGKAISDFDDTPTK